jgi:hypothetical protein
VDLGASHAPAGAENIFERGLDAGLLQIGLDDARGRIDRAAGRLIDDPVDLAGGKTLLRAGR